MNRVDQGVNQRLNEGVITSLFSVNSVGETRALARALAQKEEGPLFISFRGDLGAGKTTFTKAFISEFLKMGEEEISSPTFIYMHNYENQHLNRKVYHFDLYRLESHHPFFSMGFDDFFPQEGDKGSILLMEWSERIADYLPKKRIDLIFTVINENKREITLIDRRKNG